MKFLNGTMAITFLQTFSIQMFFLYCYIFCIQYLESKNAIAKSIELPPVVVIAGKAGSGKSTFLHNVFNIDTESGMDPEGVTKEINKTYSKCNGAEIIIYDTPGLGDSSVPYKELMRKEMRSLTAHEDYIFLYTLRANPGARIDQFDDEIIKTITEVLGEKVWDKCVLLLTFCDTTWEEKYKHNNNKDEFKKHLKDMTSAFQNILKKYKRNVTMKTIFELGPKIYEPPTLKQDIIVIPTACSAEYDSNMLLPDIAIAEDHDWTDLVFEALMRVIPAKERKKYREFRYSSKEVAVLVGGGAGALLGGAIGGCLSGQRGVKVGAAIGGTAGGVIAEVIALTIDK